MTAWPAWAEQQQQQKQPCVCSSAPRAVGRQPSSVIQHVCPQRRRPRPGVRLRGLIHSLCRPWALGRGCPKPFHRHEGLLALHPSAPGCSWPPSQMVFFHLRLRRRAVPRGAHAPRAAGLPPRAATEAGARPGSCACGTFAARHAGLRRRINNLSVRARRQAGKTEYVPGVPRTSRVTRAVNSPGAIHHLDLP